MKVAGGVCRYCGLNGEVACDATGCAAGLENDQGNCRPPCQCSDGYVCQNQQCVPETTPDNCAMEGTGCVQNFVPGAHCCTSASRPLLCVWGTCRACVPHGAECALGRTQICCSAVDGDVCKLDQATSKVICDIPDAPDSAK
jgi:hypothetical protein